MKKKLLKTIKNKWLLAVLLAAPLLSFAQLAGGTYTVGGGKNYPTLKAAVDALNNEGITAPVTFLLSSPFTAGGNFPIVINSIVGATGLNTVTFANAPGELTTVSGTSASSLIKLNGADNVIFEDLTFNNTNTAANTAVIWIASNGNDGATNNYINNCTIIGGSNATTYGIVNSGGASVGSVTTAANSFNDIYRSKISKCLYGIFSIGNSSVPNQQNTLFQNTMTESSPNNVSNGIGVFYEDSPTIKSNTINNISAAPNMDVMAINLGFFGTTIPEINNGSTTGYAVTNATISNNIIDGIVAANGKSAIGIACASSASGTTTIHHNMVSRILSNGTGTDFASGIFLGGTSGSGRVNVYYNSVAMLGNHGTVTNPNFALAINGNNPWVDVRNNILYNTSTGTNQTASKRSTCLGLGYSNSYTNLNIGYNIYYAEGANAMNYAVASVGSLTSTATPYSTLDEWQVSLGDDDLTSVSFLPDFTNLNAGSTILHLKISGTPNPLYAGVAITGITIDIDNNARPATKPYIGADEVPLKPLPLDLISFTGKASDHANTLSWITANESHTSHFDVERMVNGVDFVKVSEVAAAGDSKAQLNYSFTDKDLVKNVDVYYYRLKMVDQNSDFTYSNAVPVSGALKSKFDAFVYPNPGAGFVTLNVLNPDKENATVEVFNLSGGKVKSALIDSQDVFYTNTYDWTSLSKGMYVLKVTTASAVKTIKMIIQ